MNAGKNEIGPTQGIARTPSGLESDNSSRASLRPTPKIADTGAEPAGAFTPGPYNRRYTHGVGWSLHVPADFDGKVPGATLRVATAIGNEPDACLLQAAPDLVSALLGLLRSVEDVRDDQVSQHMGFGNTAEERADRRRQLAHYIEVNAEKVDEALEVASAVIAKALGREAASPESLGVSQEDQKPSKPLGGGE